MQTNEATKETEYITPEELRERWKLRISIRTLSNWRSLGTGPMFTKIGGRIVYPMKAVIDWESRRTTDSTSNYRQ